MRNHVYMICLSFLFIISIISLTISIIAFIKNRKKSEYLNRNDKFDLLAESDTRNTKGAIARLSVLEDIISQNISDDISDEVQDIEKNIALVGMNNAIEKHKNELHEEKKIRLLKQMNSGILDTKIKYLSDITKKGPPGTIMI